MAALDNIPCLGSAFIVGPTVDRCGQLLAVALWQELALVKCIFVGGSGLGLVVSHEMDHEAVVICGLYQGQRSSVCGSSGSGNGRGEGAGSEEDDRKDGAHGGPVSKREC